MGRDTLTQDQIKDIFYYVDGKLFWKEDRGAKKTKNKRAGNIDGEYRRIKLNGKSYREHRLVYLYHHGFMPDVIDHVDNNGHNNRIENLRPATRSQNARNRKMQNNNTSGVRGVSWNKRRKLWIVRVQVKTNSIFLGAYDDLELAELIAEEAREVYHGKEWNKTH